MYSCYGDVWIGNGNDVAYHKIGVWFGDIKLPKSYALFFKA